MFIFPPSQLGCLLCIVAISSSVPITTVPAVDLGYAKYSVGGHPIENNNKINHTKILQRFRVKSVQPGSLNSSECVTQLPL